MAKKKLYSLTDEHRAQLGPWAQKWIANAMSTAPMTARDKDITREAISGLYQAADLTPPPGHRIVFVASPLMARIVGGCAAATWYLRSNATTDATKASTEAATEAVTLAATLAAIRDDTWAATRAATRAATAAATEAATWDATLAATWAAIRDATWAATRAATAAATRAATEAATWDVTWYHYPSSIPRLAHTCAPMCQQLALWCINGTWRMLNGGNQWSGWVSFVSFFRHISKLPIDYSKWQLYESAALHSGPRVMHDKFCIVSDRPRILKVDDANRPHCEDGPFCAWSDGFELYAWHGVYVPIWVIRHPERITLETIQAEENAEVRRAMIEKRGWDWYLDAMGAAPVQTDRFGALYRTRHDDADVGIVVVTNSTPESDGSHKRYALLVPPHHETAHAAVADTFGLTAAEYCPAMET